MGEIEIYRKEGFGEIRVQKDGEGEAWFCAKDLCKSLGYTNTKKALTDHVDNDEITKRYTIDTKGRRNTANFVNESGMYALIFGSKKENARAFRKWVTKEVLPSLRKTGKYEVTQSSDDVQIQKLLVRQQDMEERIQALEEERNYQLRKITDYRRMLKEQRTRLILEKHHELVGNENILVRDMARILRELGHEVSDNGLYEWMRQWGYLQYDGEDYNLPWDIDLEAGLFKIGRRRYAGRNYRVALLTPKGQMEVIKIFEKLVRFKV